MEIRIPCLRRIIFIMAILVVVPTYAQQKPRVLISTDIGGTDPDDNQSMIHLLMYANEFDIEGLVSSPSYGSGSKEEILRMIGLYAQDYKKLKAHDKAFPKPKALRKLCKQGRRGAAPLLGFGKPTEGSEWIVKCALRNDARPLWILVWGALEDVAQALHDAPNIADKIRIYWIGGPNKKWGANAYNYVAEHFPNLWFIENNATYRGFIGNNKDTSYYQASFWENAMKGCGTLGNDFKNYYDGIVKMGDTPTLLYLMGNSAENLAERGGQIFNPDNPCSDHWGGRFEPMTISPRYIITGPLAETDTIPVYSIMEWQLEGPVLRDDFPRDSACFTMRTDKQNWAGYYVGNGSYMVRYAPKAPATLHYTITSPLSGFPEHEGTFTVGNQWPAPETYQTHSKTIRKAPVKVGKTWFTDCGDATLMGGNSDYEDYQKLNAQWQGAATIARWREAILKDWQQRFEWLR